MAKAADRGAAENAEEWLEPVTERLEALPLIGRARAPIWGIAATLLTFLLAGLHHGAPTTDSVLYPVGLLAIVVAAVHARTVVGTRTGQAPTQRSWTPGIVVGVVAGAAGYPWAPIPVVDSSGRPNAARVHLAAPLLLAGTALVLFLESAWTRAPLTEAWASAALIMCASLLLPVGPLDGKHLDKAGLAMSAGVIGAALLFGLGLL